MLRLKEFRARSDMNQRELAQKTGVSQAMISKYERGKATAGIVILKKMAEALNCSVEELLK